MPSDTPGVTLLKRRILTMEDIVQSKQFLLSGAKQPNSFLLTESAQ